MAQKPRYANAHVAPLVRALMFYADPKTYHACSFMFDRPTGGFDEDFDRKHGDDFYNRPMPGKTARKALAKLRKQLGVTSE